MNMFIFAASGMNTTCKGNINFLGALLCVPFAYCLSAPTAVFKTQAGEKKEILTLLSDSIPIAKDTSKPLNPNDSPGTRKKIDTIDLRISKDKLDGPVYYHADDSLVMEVPEKRITLYGKKTSTRYLSNELTAPGITYDQKKNLITASYVRDSMGKVLAAPVFKQDGMLTVSDSIAFNMKSGKGITRGSYTQQGEMFIYGERIKKVDSNVFFASRSRFTTCNLDTPHFSLVSNRIKFINEKFAITGPVHPEFEGVPVPVILPFGLYPLTQGRHSGFIAPAFTVNQQFGLGLEGIGYYKVINDYWDITARGNIYSYGGWTLGFSPRYFKRYKYQGNLGLDIQKSKFNFKGDPDYSLSYTYSLRWQHSYDSKARPGVNFSANVRAASTQFNQLIPNNPIQNFNNQLNSTISYTKVWKDKPFNIAIIANHSQNTNLKSFNITLPDLSFNLNTLYPFRRKEAAGTLRWYENIGIALNSNAKSQTSFTDDSLVDRRKVWQQMGSNYQWGATHNVPLTLSLPPMGPLQISPNVSYSERWYQQKFIRNWNNSANKLDTSIQRGFFTAREMSFGIGMTTRIFGMFTFEKNSRIKAIRHEIRPQVSASYTPNMNGRFYYNTQIDTFGNIARYSVFANNIVAAYGEGRFGGLSFGIDNILQMKVRDKKDTSGTGIKKATLIDGLSINSSYNFLADSFRLTAFNIGARTNLLNKINITASAFVDPYVYDEQTGRRLNRLVWKDRAFSLGKLMNASLSISSQFQGGDKTQKKNNDRLNALPINPATGLPLDENSAEAAYIRSNPGEFADFSIPWSVSFGLSLRYNTVFNAQAGGFDGVVNSDINFNGTLNITPKWQMGVTGIYNFSQGDMGVLTLSASREMHCWQMSINVSPIGVSRFFSINISPKSALLRDVRINRTRYFFDF